MKPMPEDWERAAHDQFGQALPEVPVPSDVKQRIRQRLQRAQGAAAGGLKAAVVPLPVKARPRRRALRWIAAAAAALVLMAGGPQFQQLQRRWLGPHANFPIPSPFVFAGTASAASPTVPGLMQRNGGIALALAHPLPELPQQGLILRADMTAQRSWFEQVKTRLGIAEPVTQEWDRLPLVGPVRGYRAGRLSMVPNGAWNYWADGPLVASAVPVGTPPPPEPAPGPAIGDEEAVRIATAWLKQGGLYPADPVSVHVYRMARHADQAIVEITPTKGSPLAAADDLPSVRVTLRSREVSMAQGVWPAGVHPVGDVPLRTAQEAWADLQAGRGAVVGPTDLMDAWAAHPQMTITSVTLDRTLVRSLDDHWYYLPVVLFQGEIKDEMGKAHPAIGYVSAVKPAPGQGGFELKTSLPAAPAAAPLLQIQQPVKSWLDWKPDKSVASFTIPTPEHVRQAALRIAEASGAQSGALGTPELIWSPTDVVAVVPATWNGLPAVQTIGDPQWLPAVTTQFTLTGGIRNVMVMRDTAATVGAPVGLISPEEAWRQAQAGAGLVQVIHDGRTFPGAQFAAHRTTIDRVALAYNVDNAAWQASKPAEPTYFFWGKSVVGEDFKEVEVLVMVPAVRR